MTALDQLFVKHDTDKQHDGHDYAQLYTDILSGKRMRPVRIAEFGVEKGRSIKAWLEWLPNAVITGVDINPPPEFLRGNKRFRSVVGDAGATALYENEALRGPFDMVIDDCGHTARITARILKMMTPRIVPGGWLVVEDVNIHGQAAFGPVAQTLNRMQSLPKMNARSRWPEGWVAPFRRCIMEHGICALQKW